MCGICGLFGNDGEKVTRFELEGMVASLKHRGPDGDGTFIDQNIGLGHTRLAIIDLSNNASQPMVSQDQRYILTYNGELYNYLELRKELQSLGVNFKSFSDTEVLLNALIHWGTKAIARFNGMFAFAFYDTHSKKVILARDRYGIKPLYYAKTPKGLAFGSEVKAILRSGWLKSETNQKGLLEYFTFQNFFTDQTLFKDVHLLEPGTYAEFEAKDQIAIKTTRYWDFDFQEPESPKSLNEYLEEFDYLFKQSIKRNLLSDVPVGTYLSGGMDSGSIAALASKEIPHLHSFTAGFDLSSASGLEIRFDERARAERMSYLFNTEHYEVVLKAGDMERSMKQLVYHLEEPRVGQSYPNYYAAKLASKFGKVVLSGAGGDEIFGGYPWRYYRVITSDSFEDYIDKYYVFWQRLIPNKTIRKVFSPIWENVNDVWTRDIFKDVFKGSVPQTISTPESYLNKSLYFEAKTFLHGLLVVEDKLSMASGLETRVPFLDNDLVDFAMKVPAKYKLNNIQEVIRLNENEDGNKKNKYFKKSSDGKQLMRKAMERYIPSSVTSMEKQGFSAPDASWFKGESLDYVKDIIYSNDSKIYDYLDKDATRDLVGLHLSGQENKRLLIWSLLYFENWCQEFI